MRKLAIFTEGYTEILFVEKLIEEIAGRKNVIFEKRRIVGGSTIKRRVEVVEAAKAQTDEKFYILLFDCGGDQQVKTRILEEHENLSRAGYSKIIGIRDVRPDFSNADVPRLDRELRKYIKGSLIPVEFILGVMEIEAWFLAEHTHFIRIDSRLTPATLRASLGLDVVNDDLSLRPEPSSDLDQAYSLVGRRYTKPGQDTVGALDYAHLYLELGTRVPYLGQLTSSIDAFLA